VSSCPRCLAVFGDQGLEVDGVGVAGLRAPMPRTRTPAGNPRDVTGRTVAHAVVVNDRLSTTPRRARGAV